MGKLDDCLQSSLNTSLYITNKHQIQVAFIVFSSSCAYAYSSQGSTIQNFQLYLTQGILSL